MIKKIAFLLAHKFLPKKKRWSTLELLNCTPPKNIVKRKIAGRFETRLGYRFDENNPKSFCEKIQYLKLNYRHPLMPIYADKYCARALIENAGFGEYLPKIYGVYENINSIDLSKLPNKFVLKTNHDSGGAEIIKDKSALSRDVLDRIKKRMHYPYIHGILHGEWHYFGMKRRIIAEELLQDPDGELRDFKVHCFGGQPHYIHVDMNRNSNHKRAFFNSKWENQGFSTRYPIYREEIDRPECLDLMLHISNKISESFPYARVDFYIIGTRLVIGEVTFFHGSGFEKFIPCNKDAEWGSLITIPK